MKYQNKWIYEHLGITRKALCIYEDMGFIDKKTTQNPKNKYREYIVREDILMCVKDAALSDKQLQALLKLERPVTEIYEAFRMRETNQIDIVKDTIKCQANAMIRANFLRDQHGER